MTSNIPVIQLEIKGYIAYVTLNRPQQHNGLDMDMFRQVLATAKRIKKNKTLRAVVLSGNGPSFCAGLDFKYFSSNPRQGAKLVMKWPWSKDNLAQKINQCWRDLPIPVISVVHGCCYGAGIQMVLATDYRIATPDSEMSILEAKWGLIPDMSGMVGLSRLTRLDIAQELTMTGRMFSGTEAKEYGLVSQLSDNPMAEAIKLAETLSEKSPDAVAAAKFLFKKTWKKDTRMALFWERWVQYRVIFTKNRDIAMKNGFIKDKSQHQSFGKRTSF